PLTAEATRPAASYLLSPRSGERARVRGPALLVVLLAACTTAPSTTPDAATSTGAAGTTAAAGTSGTAGATAGTSAPSGAGGGDASVEAPVEALTSDASPI